MQMSKSKSAIDIKGQHNFPTAMPPKHQSYTDYDVGTVKDLMRFRTKNPPDLQVCDPQIIGSGPTKHHAYKLRGSDYVGEVDCMRRYKEFNHLREVFFGRFPGLYIPALPPKKKIVSNGF